jgi:adenylate kinase family enzyme
VALYFITGIPGSGKSTVLAALRTRGFEAYDVDEAGPVTAKWHHNTTGFVHPKSSVSKAARTPDFLSNHSWKVPRVEVAALAEQVAEKPIFLGGAIANDPELQDLFDTVFALAVDDDTLRQRLTSRTTSSWGSSPHELAMTMAANQELAARYADFGYVIIDAIQPTEAIIAKILRSIHDH